MAATPQINSYVEGNRVIVTATCKVLPSGNLTTPSTWQLLVRNVSASEVIEFNSVGPVLPEDVNADMQNPSAGIITFAFDCDAPGIRKVYFKGTGQCKCAGKHSFMIEENEV